MIDISHKMASVHNGCADDADAVGGMIFNRWLADCDTKGISIDWEDLL